jgi:type I restriction enzyme R subunit
MAEGGVVAEPKKKKKYEPRRLLALDIDDHIDPTTREWISVDENGNMVFPEASEQKAAELGTRFEAWLLAREDINPGEESWLRMISSQLRANAGSMDEFSTGHFAFHPFSQLGGYPQAVRVFGGEKRLEALIDSLNAAVFGQDDGQLLSGSGDQPTAH